MDELAIKSDLDVDLAEATIIPAPNACSKRQARARWQARQADRRLRIRMHDQAGQAFTTRFTRTGAGLDDRDPDDSFTAPALHVDAIGVIKQRIDDVIDADNPRGDLAIRASEETEAERQERKAACGRGSDGWEGRQRTWDGASPVRACWAG
ncbi:MAG: hypothetical protein ACI841_005459 [Planctomycetota bacterium]|jgi:hypothetical protein